MKKIFKNFNIISIMNIIIYLAFMFDSSRIAIKRIIIIFFNNEISDKIANLYQRIIKYCKFEIYIFFIIIAIYVIFQCVKKYLYQNIYLKYKQLSKLNDASTPQAYKSINTYLNSKEKRTFLLTGDWGSGKTYTINKFFEDYYKYTNRKVYKISCFGLEGRDSILKEMKNIFETEDDSITKKILKLINKIPIVGDFLEGILKNDYELKDIAENSIFIFDDFERIAPLNELKNRMNKRKARREYSKLQMQKQRMYNTSNIQSNSDYSEEYQVLSKYNVVVGIINELVDRYNMKVIILCNTNEIDSVFAHEIFECKLDCKKYRIESNPKVFLELAKRTMENNIDIKVEKKRKMEEFFKSINDDINNIWDKTKIENIRILLGIISAFIEIIEKYDDIDEKLYIDIFYSIYLYHILYYDQGIDFFTDLKIGQNIYCYYLKIKKIGIIKRNAIVRSIEETVNKNVRWVGIEIASSWLIGENVNCTEKLKKINDYHNNKIEESIVNNKEIPEQSVYRFDDLMYILSCDTNKEENIIDIIDKHDIDFEYINYKRKDRIQRDDFFGKVSSLCEYFNEKTEILDDDKLMKSIFIKIYDKYQYEKLEKEVRFSEFEKRIKNMYNIWLQEYKML